MKRLFLSTSDFFSKRKYLFSFAAGLFFTCSFALIPLTAHAGIPEDIGTAVGNAVSAVFTGGLGVVLSPVTALMWIIYKISTMMLGVAGILFNWSVLIVVFEFSKYFGNSEGMTLAWGILRDFANIGLLFGFVFMGIATILDLHKYPWTKALPKLIIYAVLLNFSLFATEAIIDTTNVVSASLYEQTYGQEQQCSAENWLGCMVNTGLAGVVLQKIQITSVYEEYSLEATASGIQDQMTRPVENILKYALLTLVVSIITIVFFAAASMLISRGVVLAFLMLVSPIGFAGMAIPQLEKLAQDWWKKLIDQALFAPVFILLLIASLRMTDGLKSLLGSGGLAAALSLTDVGNTTGTLMYFSLIVGFMVASLIMAQRFGIYGASTAVNSASAFVFGTQARAANLFGGGAAYGVRRMIIRNPTLRKNGIARGLIDLPIVGMKSISKTNLDGRRLPGVGNILGLAGISAGAKPAEHALFEDTKHLFEEGRADTARKKREAETNREIKVVKLEDNAHKDDGTHNLMPDEDKDFLNDLNEAQLIQLHGIKDAVRGMVGNLHPDKFESLMKSDKIDDVTKDTMKSEREIYLKSNNGIAGIRVMKPEVVVKLPAGVLTDRNVLRSLNAAQLGRIDPDNLDPTKRNIIANHIRTEMTTGTPLGNQFRVLMTSSSAVGNRWRAYV